MRDSDNKYPVHMLKQPVYVNNIRLGGFVSSRPRWIKWRAPKPEAAPRRGGWLTEQELEPSDLLWKFCCVFKVRLYQFGRPMVIGCRVYGPRGASCYRHLHYNDYVFMDGKLDWHRFDDNKTKRRVAFHTIWVWQIMRIKGKTAPISMKGKVLIPREEYERLIELVGEARNVPIDPDREFELDRPDLTPLTTDEQDELRAKLESVREREPEDL